MSKIVGAHSGGRIGEIMDHGSSSLPIYSLPCNGAAVSRSTYAVLFAVIGTTYGVGDGSTTFNVPNGLALFKRGAGSQSVGGLARSATHGATANDSMQGHQHSNSDPGHQHSVLCYDNFTAGNPPTIVAGTVVAANSGLINGAAQSAASGITVTNPVTDGSNGTPRTANETAPVSLGITYGIVWK